MPLALPAPDPASLPRTPLDLVVCQIRFENKLENTAPQVGLAFHEAIGGPDGDYSRLNEVKGQGVDVDLSRAQVNRTEGPHGWQYQSRNAAWTVSLFPDHVALECHSDYPGWDEFSARLDQIIKALVDHVEPAIEHRVGLRYIDHIAEIEATRPSDWVRFLAPEILGFAAHESLGQHIVHARQQVLLDLGEDYQCVINHGFVPGDNGRLGYGLDYDVSREGGRPFDVETLRETLGVLHDDALKLFQASITSDLHDFFAQT
ncbi:MAG TPA: TIGR04255 family protein [Solirubrobacteraceae bacterium]